MPTDRDKNDKDIEIIPPDRSGRRGDEQWIHVSVGDGAKAFNDLPLHKRILLGAASLAGAVVFGLTVFLIIASAVLIWIPLLLATILIAGIFLFFRAKLRRR